MKTLIASFKFSMIRLWNASSSAAPLPRKLVLVLDLLTGELHQILVDDVANVFEIDCKSDDFRGASAISVIKASAGYPMMRRSGSER